MIYTVWKQWQKRFYKVWRDEMRSSVFRAAWLLAILTFTALACGVLNDVQERAGTTRQTVEAAATKIEQGQDLLATAQAFTTQVGGQSLIPTAQAFATQLGESGVLVTAKAVATQQGPALLSTAAAIATEQGSAFLSTAVAIATQQGPSLVGTAQAFATQIAQATPAADLPLVGGDLEIYAQSPALLSYTTPLPFAQVLDFYKQQMQAYGWEINNTGSFETASTAHLRYQKGDRRASVNVATDTRGTRTLVVIIVQP
jgi:hypothetical protein